MAANGTTTGGGVRTGDAPHAIDNPAQNRFELYLGDDLVGILGYHGRGGDESLGPGAQVGFMHTVIVEDHWREGLAGRLVGYGLDAARERGWRVRPVCTYVQRFVTLHPQYADLIDD